MPDDHKKAGYYILEDFKVFPIKRPDLAVQLNLVIHKWEMLESLSSGHMYGHATVYDSDGLLDGVEVNGEFFRIRGEEEIIIRYRDWFMNPREERMYLYSVTKHESPRETNDTFTRYTIHFCSIQKFLTEIRTIQRSFNDSISNMVQEVFKDYYDMGHKDLLYEPTEGQSHLVVPRYTPEQAMELFARKAFSGENRGQLWRFFEARDRFFFCTQEYLQWLFENEPLKLNKYFKEKIQYGRFTEADSTPEGQALLMRSMIDFKLPDYVNTIGDHKQGAYYRRTSELDFLNRTNIQTEYQYLEEYQDYKNPEKIKSKHTKEFVDQFLSDPVVDTLLVKDYPAIGSQGGNGVRPYTYYPEIYNTKGANFYHLSKEASELKCYGRCDLTPGQIINLTLVKKDKDVEDRKTDKLRSGDYMVLSIRHTFHEEMYYATMEVSRNGDKGEPEPPKGYERIMPQTLPFSKPDGAGILRNLAAPSLKYAKGVLDAIKRKF